MVNSVIIAYMETLLTVLMIIQAMSISLGVGVSTMAILNFFYAISDGTIDPIERGFMGVTYITLRVAMVIIILAFAGMAVIGQLLYGQMYLTGYVLAQFTLIAGLFLNASLMTARIMPSKFGPAIQASCWYALGFILALVPLGYSSFSYPIFISAFIPFTLLMIVLVNLVMKSLQK